MHQKNEGLGSIRWQWRWRRMCYEKTGPSTNIKCDAGLLIYHDTKYNSIYQCYDNCGHMHK